MGNAGKAASEASGPALLAFKHREHSVTGHGECPACRLDMEYIGATEQILECQKSGNESLTEIIQLVHSHFSISA